MKKVENECSLPTYEVETLLPGAQMQFKQINAREYNKPYESVIEFRIKPGNEGSQDITILVAREEAITMMWALRDAVGIEV